MKRKKFEQDKIESSNLLEQASEIFESCINCGICKSACSISRATGEEHLSGRGQAVLLKEKILDPVIFQNSLDRGADFACPLEIAVTEGIRKARMAAVLKGQGLKKNEEMIENLRKFGNPYGESLEKK